MLRGVAAYLVLAGHLRAYIFQSFSELEIAGSQAGALVKSLYFATGLGHQAVIIFFALSGFLVGGTMLDNILSKRFCWSRYLLRRLTRLWIVIIPALLLTLVFDYIGMKLTGGAGYDGRYFDLYAEGPSAPIGVDHSVSTFLGNAVFLQTMYVATFGSNAPMWSLANEFWYYIIFPIIPWIVFSRASMAAKGIGLSVMVSILAVMPAAMLEGGAIWVAGAAAFGCSRQQAFSAFLTSNLIRFAALIFFVVALASSRTPGWSTSDLALGLAVAAVLPVFAHFPSPGGIYSRVVRGLSEISYTLYLTHFPFLTLIVFAGLSPTRWPPNWPSAAIYAALLCAATAWAAIVWWCFERHTNVVYGIFIRGLGEPNPSAPGSGTAPKRKSLFGTF
jgi:peptidoglycan/LPS O-acetylase OafA/YrhL